MAASSSWGAAPRVERRSASAFRGSRKDKKATGRSFRTMSSGSKVLIVDDERNMRATLSRILVAAGHNAIVADSGEQAVAICDKEPFDVVLMDVRMTGMNGVDAFRVI